MTLISQTSRSVALTQTKEHTKPFTKSASKRTDLENIKPSELWKENTDIAMIAETMDAVINVIVEVTTRKLNQKMRRTENGRLVKRVRRTAR